MTPEYLEEIVGEDAAIAIMSARAGVRVYVPNAPTDRLIDELGGDAKAAEKLCSECGGTFLILPTAKRWRAQKLLKRGFSQRDVALAIGMTRRAVQHALREVETPVRHELPPAKVA